MSVDLRGKIHGLIKRAVNLRQDAIAYYQAMATMSTTRGHSNVLKTYFKIYNSIRNDVVGLFHSSDKTVNNLPLLFLGDEHSLGELIILVANLDQVTGFLEGKQVGAYGTTIRTFPVQEKELEILPSTTKLLMLEAIEEFNHFHSYACCCISGLAFESLVKEGCRKNNLEYKGLANGIKALKEAKVIKEDLHKSLMDLEKYYRDKISAHLTSEVATDEKARLFLSSLLSLGKAIFAS